MSKLTKNQTRKFRADYYENGGPCTLVATVRYDDQCGNGHNSFSITGDLYEKHVQRGEPAIKHKDGATLWLNSCGCLHDEIAKHLPELAPYIKWHLTSSDGPMHYIGNTMYHADEHGPTRAWVYYSPEKDGTPLDPLNLSGYSKENGKECLLGYFETEKAKRAEGQPGYRVEWDTKTAKAANIEHARSSAVWPDATLEQLRDKAALEARLPALLAEFRAAVESLGFTY